MYTNIDFLQKNDILKIKRGWAIMDKVNVLLIGNSGVGKSTLINAVLENKVAKTSIGERGTVKMDVYESDSVPFRLIDSKGMEYSFFWKFQIKKWIKKMD